MRLELNNWLIFQTTALGMLLLASSFNGFGVSRPLPPIQTEEVETKIDLPVENIKKEIETSITVEEYIKKYFSDIPIMIEIAWCESSFRHFDKNGEALRGNINRLDRGVMQINEFYHLEESKRLGYDIMTLEGNTAYARFLYEKSGVAPWRHSSRCWTRSDTYYEYKKELATR